MIVYLDGELMPAAEARVSVFDRSFLMGDGLYDGLRSESGAVIGLDRHVERMRAGLEAAMFEGFDAASLGSICEALLRANDLRDAFIYVQVSRGAPGPGAPVRGRIPEGVAAPTVFAYAESVRALRSVEAPPARRVALLADRRWTMGHIKCTSLMGGVLAAMEAARAGCDDAIMVRDGLVTEGTATNVFVSTGGKVVTPDLESVSILGGVTRAMLIDESGGAIEERPVTRDELLGADEVMLAGTRTGVAQVVSIDGEPVGTGDTPGERSMALHGMLVRAVERDIHCRDG